MSTTGLLTDFSLSEIFQFIDKGHKTGLLRLRTLPKSEPTPQLTYYIWVHQGRIVAAANRLNHQGLMSLIARCHMVSDRVFDKLVNWCCPINEPLGLYLKNQGVLNTKQLQRLFRVQVLQPVCILFHLKEAQFRFDQNVPLPTREMTGLSIPTIVLNQYAFIQSLLEKVDNYCLNWKALPCEQLDAVPLYPVFCSLYSRPCNGQSCPKVPCHQPIVPNLESQILRSN